MITISDTAQDKIRSIIQTRRPDVKGLRLGYEGRNRYNMMLIDEITEDEGDIIIPFTGFDLLIDTDSAARMEGTHIDYVETDTESGFKIENPLDNVDTAPRPTEPPSEGKDKEIFERAQDLIETEVNPSVAMHGGVITLIDVKDGTVFVELGGGCQGCGMASVTLKQGIERILRAEIPDIVDILDVTDHAGGRNPYYAPAGK